MFLVRSTNLNFRNDRGKIKVASAFSVERVAYGLSQSGSLLDIWTDDKAIDVEQELRISADLLSLTCKAPAFASQG